MLPWESNNSASWNGVASVLLNCFYTVYPYANINQTIFFPPGVFGQCLLVHKLQQELSDFAGDMTDYDTTALAVAQ